MWQCAAQTDAVTCPIGHDLHLALKPVQQMGQHAADMRALRLLLTVPKQAHLTCLTLGTTRAGLTKHVLCRMQPLSAPKSGRQMPSSICLAGKEESMKQSSTPTLTLLPEAS